MNGRECLETDVTEVRSCATSPMGGRNFNSRLIARGSLNSFLKIFFFIIKHFFLFVSRCCILYLFFRRILKRERDTDDSKIVLCIHK
jgi:hypothetical protein